MQPVNGLALTDSPTPRRTSSAATRTSQQVDASGDFRFPEGNIGGGADPQDVVLVYGQTYQFNGWTIVSTIDGTRLTYDGTGHGMFVAIDGVSSF